MQRREEKCILSVCYLSSIDSIRSACKLLHLLCLGADKKPDMRVCSLQQWPNEIISIRNDWFGWKGEKKSGAADI